MSIIYWIKTHKLVTLLILVIAFLLLRSPGSYAGSSLDYSSFSLPGRSTVQPMMAAKSNLMMPDIGIPVPRDETVVVSDNRMVIKNSDLSLLVTDVRKTSDEIIIFAKGLGGYMVSSSYSRPEESPFATVTVRVPSSNLDNALSYIRSLGVRVTNENLMGSDVTGAYTDIEARLTTLKKTQTKFSDILEKASNVQDILSVQRELISLQDQTDALIGQKDLLSKNVELTKITVFLSTDELALPYTPDKAFRPNLIFKEAVRSVLNSLRQLGETSIWIGVYSVFWLPLLLGFLIYKRFKRN